MSSMNVSWWDKFLLSVAPSYGLNRLKSRATAQSALRSYEAAGTGRRTSGWHRSSTDANGAAAASLVTLRELSRDLRRNNGWARRGIRVISANTIGRGIQAKSVAKSDVLAARSAEVWKNWTANTSCDFDGRLSFTGIQRLVMDTVVESGEVLVVKDVANSSDGLPVPIRIRVIEADFIDASRDGKTADGHISAGIEYDGRGRRVAYWLFKQHPGSTSYGNFKSVESYRQPAEDVIHIYRMDRPGQARGVPWLACAIAKLNDLNDYDDARLMQAKIAACFGAFVTDEGTGMAIGSQEGTDEEDRLETLEPGHIEYLAPGKSISFPTPPSVSDHGSFTEAQLRYISACLDVPYEELTTDYSKVNFSSARMARQSHWSSVHDWRRNMIIPLLCDGVWAWVMESAKNLEGWKEQPTAEWYPPPMPMLSPEKEGMAYTRLVRSGAMTLNQSIRERGEDPDTHLAEIAATNKLLDKLGIKLDSDPRHMSGSGIAQAEVDDKQNGE